jgi:carbonic anhydrase
MLKVLRGVQQFQTEVFKGKKELFETLATGQFPQALFITCSDSRVNPNLVTQTDPGDLFIVRNAGNIVPAYTSQGAEAAAIEFAVAGLNVEHIIVCGHSGCGAMKAVLKPETTEGLPALSNWLSHAEATRRITLDNYAERDHDEQLNLAIQENVLCQLTNLRTHPVVASRIAAGRLQLHAWVYKIADGKIFAYDDEQSLFVPLTDEFDITVDSRRSLTDVLR